MERQSQGVEQRVCSIPQSLNPLIPVAALTFFAVLFIPTVADACPGCKEALFDPGQLQQKLSTAKGYALSIGLMLTVPLLLIGGVATLIVRASRRGKRLSQS